MVPEATVAKVWLAERLVESYVNATPEVVTWTASPTVRLT